MAISVVCKNGHRYLYEPPYPDRPRDAPRCPECYEEWLAQQPTPPATLSVHVKDEIATEEKLGG